MMPTFPRSPLSFRTAGFPQYGWKADLSGGPSWVIQAGSLSLLPACAVNLRRFAPQKSSALFRRRAAPKSVTDLGY
jgi:hypothetical protein